MGALTEILKKPGDLKIRKIYHSRFSDSLLSAEHPYDSYAREFYAELDRLDPAATEVVDLREPGLALKIDGLNHLEKYNKVQGQPFKVAELTECFTKLLEK